MHDYCERIDIGQAREMEMKKLFKGILLAAVIFCFSCGCFAWNDEIAGTTEITGYYQQYRDFSFENGTDGTGRWIEYDFAPRRLGGVGISVAQNFAEWFAIWTQLTIFGTTEQWSFGNQIQNSVRVINNLQGIRYQTKQYGPLRFYGKVGAGIAWYGFNLYEPNYNSYVSLGGTKFSTGYGGGINVWFNRNIGLTLDATHTLIALPNLSDLENRDKFDSGMTYTTGLTFRF